MLAVNEDLISEVMKAIGLEFVMHVGQRKFDLRDVSITRSKVPVRKPTTRGGVYFTDVMAYKVRGSTGDLSILELLPRIMLGPNTQFEPVELRTTLSGGGSPREAVLVSHVANTVNTKDRVELNMVVDSTRP